jgi:hypothetical protein
MEKSGMRWERYIRGGIYSAEVFGLRQLVRKPRDQNVVICMENLRPILWSCHPTAIVFFDVAVAPK